MHEMHTKKTENTPIHAAICQTIRNVQSNKAFTGPRKAKIDQYFMIKNRVVFSKKCDNDISAIF